MPPSIVSPGPATTLKASVPGVEEGLRRVEAKLDRLSRSSALPAITDGTHHVVKAGGRRLRPALMLATGLALDGSVNGRLVTSAACVELLHAGSLVHDDLMDDSAERRGVPTLNAEKGAGYALMVGDFLVARAGLAALRSASRAVAEELATATVQLAEGQFLEMQDLFDAGRTPEKALASVERKTAALFRAGCSVAARCVRAGEAERLAMAEYGHRFGVVFQLLDDVLDLFSTAELLGKPVGNDLRQGVYTLPLIHALRDERLRPVRDRLADGGRELSDADIEWIIKELRSSGVVGETLRRCRTLAREAAEALPPIASACAAGALREFPLRYVEWARGMVAEPE
ncbi:polyprenyl synthetase family protein [Microbispora sp. NPDC049125]|uniref:polyprenyl synthetase family protein n=1 Tax=Microbispora sp. NPDC049125 TaxID=3154929 RepID=UPI003466C52E